MHWLAILPIVLSTVTLILTFLCLFAGDSPGFLEDWALVTLNTSRFGENIVNLTSSDSSNNTNALQSLLNQIGNTISQDINDAINEVSKDFGLRDFYSLHVLTHCEGLYEPGVIPNATLSRAQIWQNTTACSNRTALFTWDPRRQLQTELNATGHSYIDTTKLNWPSQIDDSIRDLQDVFKAGFVLYCIAIGLTFMALALAAVSFFLTSRLWTTVNLIFDLLALLALLIASALITAIMKQGTKKINDYGEAVGIEAYYSSKFLAVTWVATSLMFVASCVWCVNCCTGQRHKGRRALSQDDEHLRLAETKAHN